MTLQGSAKRPKTEGEPRSIQQQIAPPGFHSKAAGFDEASATQSDRLTIETTGADEMASPAFCIPPFQQPKSGIALIQSLLPTVRHFSMHGAHQR
jgi:hypothetical protein